MAKKYLDENGLLYLWQKIKAKFISDVTYNSTSRKIQKTQNGTTSDVITLSKVATSNSYNDLDNKPTIPEGVEKSTTVPKMDGTAAVGSETKFAAGDHVHPSDTSRVPTTRTVAGHSLSSDIILKTEDIIDGEGSHTLDETLDYKVDVIDGKGLSTNDYTTAEKNKLNGISAGAEVNVQADWNETNTSSDAYIKNKPTIPSGVEVDDELSSTSVNPVQNKVINNALPFKVVIGETDFQTVYNAFVANRFIYGVDSDTDNYWFFMTPDLGANSTFYFARIEDFGAHINIGYMSVDDANGWQATNSYDLISITDTVTTSRDGLMLSTDKVKLNKLLFDSNNLIDSSILPSYVDDVIEAYPRSGQTPLSQNWLATGSASGTVITPEAGKIYILMANSGDYTTNTQFRWSGTTYVKLNDGGVSSITNAEIDTIIAS